MLIHGHSTVVPYLHYPEIVCCCVMYVAICFFQADYERRLLQLCYKGTADISQFRELLRQGIDVNSYDEVGTDKVVRPAQYNNTQMKLNFVLFPLAMNPFTSIKLQTG